MNTNPNSPAVGRVVESLLNPGHDGVSNIVLIWGAGASIPCGVPGGYYLIQRMRMDLQAIKETWHFRETFKDESEDSRNSLDNEHISFEHVLKVYARLYGISGLHEWLRQFIPDVRNTQVPYFPTFAHEYAAHLVNNGLLKYSISLNFDEILESALQDELGINQFVVAASKSEFERFSARPKHEWATESCMPEAKCFVFKPHGTISRALTLRHLPEFVTQFDAEKKSVLAECLRGALPVFLGFGNYDEDMWLLFGETYARGLTDDVVIVDINPENVGGRLSNRGTVEVYNYRGSVNSFFCDISSVLSSGGHYGTYRQKPTRHRIRTMLFDIFSRKLALPEDEDRYRQIHRRLSNIPRQWFYRRIYELELLIYLLKTKGLFIQIATGDCQRIAKAYDACLLSGCKGSLEPVHVLSEIFAERKDLFNSSAYKDRIGKKSPNIKWCFLLIPENLNCTDALTDQFEKNEPLLKTMLRSICADVGNTYCQYLRGIIPPEGFHVQYHRGLMELEKELPNLLVELYEDFDVDITDKDRSIAMRFAKPIPLRSRRALSGYTDKLLQGDWNVLRLATISAQWFAKKLARSQGQEAPRYITQECKIYILGNRHMFLDKDIFEPINLFHYVQMALSIANLLHAIWKNGVPCTLEYHAYENLENHITLVSKARTDTEEEEIRGAVYFRRRGKDTSISPVAIEDKDDLESIKQYFDSRLNREMGPDAQRVALVSEPLFQAKIDAGGIAILPYLSADSEAGTVLLAYLKQILPELTIK